MTTAKTNLPVREIDQLGAIKAQIADLKALESELIKKITALGEGAYDGLEYRAAVSAVSEVKSLDVKAAEAKLRELGVDGRWFNKHLKTRAGYTAVRVSARRA